MVKVFTADGDIRDERVPAHVPQIAGWVQGVPRLGIPDLLITDAALGITNPGGGREGDNATALPAGIALGASFNRELARQAGAVLGREAKEHGFNVLCGGSMNLIRHLHNGRNFEYISEDPLLSGEIAGETVLGTQSEGVISLLKHVSLNASETNKFWLDAIIDPAAHRESDLLAFELAIEIAEPGALMAGYNKVNGEYSGGNATILNDVIKGAFGYRGWIMSDWRAVYSWRFADFGLDQHSGAQLDEKEWFAEPLAQALAAGEFSRERLSDMVRRILRSIIAVGATGEKGPAVDRDAHALIAREAARQGIVLLKNEGGLLPLAGEGKKIAVIGGHAHLGVPAGFGSSLTLPAGGFPINTPLGGAGPLWRLRREALHPSAPLDHLRRLLPGATFVYDPGLTTAAAVAAAKRADIAIVFGVNWEGEGFDNADRSLPRGQDEVIAAVAAANPATIVVLESGNPPLMPWLDAVPVVVEAWYSGQNGGEAIAEVLTGAVNPGGRLPVTFPASDEQLVFPTVPNYGDPWGTPATIEYLEGSDVGYRHHAKHAHVPAFAFGHGLSYTSFAYGDIAISAEGGEVRASVTITNTGDRAGAEVAQLYATSRDGETRQRLLDYERVELEPGASATIELVADPRLLADYDTAAGTWHIAGGEYGVAVGRSAVDFESASTVRIADVRFGH
ncbi:glycoside hydrolase family 3 protein [Protaetiibacter larvae]|uniref:Glycoside hydrolase family 3 protein n=2 Tax=Protaetiibacter larvae TaxID=2592654 RepID=A0A5C1YBH5_9MICO|nr:glycoside hydrolase family 3 protein [Protaetiibacter larvae]